jgi:hypothetical protein
MEFTFVIHKNKSVLGKIKDIFTGNTGLAHIKSEIKPNKKKK